MLLIFSSSSSAAAASGSGGVLSRTLLDDLNDDRNNVVNDDGVADEDVADCDDVFDIDIDIDDTTVRLVDDVLEDDNNAT